jgi:hypothetical protein
MLEPAGDDATAGVHAAAASSSTISRLLFIGGAANVLLGLVLCQLLDPSIDED